MLRFGAERGGAMRAAIQVPATISAEPESVFVAIGSPRKRKPHNTPKSGIRNVTVRARAAPMVAIRRKYSRYAKAVDARARASTLAATSSVSGPGGVGTKQSAGA